MPTFIKTGFWTKVAKAYDKALNLTKFVQDEFQDRGVPYLADFPDITVTEEIDWPVGAGGVYGACLSSINGCIYAAPQGVGSYVVKFNPVTKTATTVGSPVAGGYKGIVQAGNGMIYCIPDNATAVLKIDPNTDTVSTFGSIAGSNKYDGGVLAPNGKIYCIPWSATAILVIDPATDTVTTFGSFSGGNKWDGGVLGRDGLIYGFPYNAASVLVINPTSNTAFSTGIPNTSGAYRCSGGILHPTEDKIIGCPAEFRSMFIYEYITGARYFTPEILPNVSYKNRAAVLAPDRKTMVCNPYNVRDILLFNVDTEQVCYKDPKTGLTVTTPKLYGVGYKSYNGVVLAKDGKIYCVSGGNKMLVISGFSGYTDSMTTLPTNLATDLATSDYNLFQNKF